MSTRTHECTIEWQEMVRVLKPGGTLVIACWCQRDNSTRPFSPAEQRRVDFMCTEWSHPYFISIKVRPLCVHPSLLLIRFLIHPPQNKPIHTHAYKHNRTLRTWPRGRA